MTRRKPVTVPPLDVNKIAGYMSPGAAQGVFGQRLSDEPAAFGNRLSGSQVPPQVRRKRQLDNAWDDLEHAQDFEQQRDAVMELTELIMGTDADIFAGDDAWRIISVELPPAPIVSDIYFYGVVSDQDSPEMHEVTLECMQPLAVKFTPLSPPDVP